MPISFRPNTLRAQALMLLLPLLGACDQSSQSMTGTTASAPSLVYSDTASTGSYMDQLGLQLALLERELDENEYNQTDQEIVVSILAEMEQIATSLLTEDAGEGHGYLQEDMTAFIDSLSEARIAAESSPPRYYAAGKVAGGCVNCHEIRG